MKAEDINPNRFVLDTKGAADLRLKLKQDPQAGLKQAAQQFEGMLLQMMLKSMREAMPQDGLLDSDQTRFFTTILDQQLAQNLSSRNALGFAKAIEQSLGRGLPSEGNDTLNDALGRLRQSVSEQQVSQPNAFAAGETVVTKNADISIESQGGSLMGVKAGANLADVIKAINALGANPQDLLSILQAMKAAGALRAELEII